MSPDDGRLDRRLGTGDAIVVGLGAMLGAGVFVAFAPAAKAAGSALLLGLAVAALVAYCNATSSARLAALYPESGGAYVYGRRRLGNAWGLLAGWAFVTGKVASCAAIALTFGEHTWPRYPRSGAIAAVVAVTALNYRGIQKPVRVTRLIVALTLGALAVVVVACIAGGDADVARVRPFDDMSLGGVLRAAALLFFAFAGYARIATLGEEVRDPARAIPRAIAVALGVTLAVYAAVAVSALLAVGAPGLAGEEAPLVEAVTAGRFHELAPLVRAGASVATFGTLLSLLLGVSRTTFAMARDGYLPRTLAVVHPAFRVPHHADVAVGAVVLLVVAFADVRGAIGFSSFAVLLYYAVANAAAGTLRADERRPPRWVPATGLVSCVLLATVLVVHRA